MGRETEWVGLSEASLADGLRELEAEVERLEAKIEAALALLPEMPHSAVKALKGE